MTIEVKAPNGSTINFPDGTDPGTINQVMGEHFGSSSPAAPAKPTGFLSGIRDAITGESHKEPGVGEFGFGDIPDANVTTGASAALPAIAKTFGADQALQDRLGKTGIALDASWGAPRFALEGGFFLDSNEKSRAGMIKQQIPTAEFKRDAYGNLQVRTLPDAPWKYLNEPGLSQNDVETFITEGARHIPDALLSMLPQGWLARIGLAGAGAAANTAASQQAAKTVGGAGPNAGDVAMSAIGSMAGQGGADLAAVGVPAVKSAVGRALDFVGERLPARAPLKTVVTDAAAGIKAAEDAAAAKAVARDPALSRQAQADKYGIPLTEGQATGDLRKIQREDDMLTGGSTQAAQNIMDRQVAEQADRMAKGGVNLATRGNPATGETIEDAGLALQGALATRRQALKDIEDDAYADAFSAARADAIMPDNQTLPAQVHAALAPEDALQIAQGADGQWFHVAKLPDGKTQGPPHVLAGPFPDLPTAQSAAESAESFVRAPDAEGVIGSLQKKIDAGRANFGTVERARQELNTLWESANNQGDVAKRNAVKRVIGILDDWVESSMTSADARKLLGDARQIHKERMGLYGQSGPDDIGGKFLERAIELERTGHQIADSIIGAGNRPPAQALATVKRIKEIATTTTKEGRVAARPGATAGARGFKGGGDLPIEIQSLREAMLRRLTGPLLNRKAGRRLPVEGVVNNLKKALDGEGSAIIRELFTEDEIKELRGYMQVLEYTVTPDGVGRSGTAQAAKRMIEAATNGMLSRFTGLISLPVEQVTSQMAAHSAFNRVTPRAIHSGDARPLAVAGGAALAHTDEAEPAQ